MVALTYFISLVCILIASVSAAPVRRDDTRSGSGTFYTPGKGACGITNSASDFIVAVSAQLFDNYPGAGSNPNANPICRKTLTAQHDGRTVTATVTDRCNGCAYNDLDFSPAAFNKLADPSAGRISINWKFD